MTRRAMVLGAAFLLLAVGWLVAQSGWLRGVAKVPIVAQVMAQRRPERGQAYPVVFSLATEQVLREIRVAPVSSGDASATVAIWHVAGRSDEPARAFVYGRPIAGLEPVESTDTPHGQPLQPNTPYRLTLVTDAGRGQTEFQTPAAR